MKKIVKTVVSLVLLLMFILLLSCIRLNCNKLFIFDIIGEGDQEGLCWGEWVEELGMEITGWSDDEWSILRSIWEPT